MFGHQTFFLQSPDTRSIILFRIFGQCVMSEIPVGFIYRKTTMEFRLKTAGIECSERLYDSHRDIHKIARKQILQNDH